jgi:hypothetical protein
MLMQRKTAGLMLAAAAAAIGLTAAVGQTTAAAAPDPGSNYFLIGVQVASGGPDFCLQPADPAGGPGTAIVQEPCNTDNDQAQAWAPVNVGGSTYEFLNQASGECLDARGGAARGTPIQQWTCNTISNEHWSWPHTIPAAFWPLGSQVAGSSNFCLDVPQASQVAGVGMQLYTCNGTPAQAWAIVGPVA